MNIQRRGMIATVLASIAALLGFGSRKADAASSERGIGLRNKRIAAKRAEDGCAEFIEWDEIKPGDWILISDWNEHGRLEKQSAFIAKSSPYGEYGVLVPCQVFANPGQRPPPLVRDHVNVF